MLIQKYEVALDKGVSKYYAITKDKKRIEMPEQFKDMYDDDHLAIQQVKYSAKDMPELLGFDSGDVDTWIPLLTKKAQ